MNDIFITLKSIENFYELKCGKTFRNFLYKTSFFENHKIADRDVSLSYCLLGCCILDKNTKTGALCLPS